MSRAGKGSKRTSCAARSPPARLIIPANVNHPNLVPVGIGAACTCKINANIGNSSLSSDEGEELEKLRAALECGADAVMDLSTGPEIDAIRRAIVARSPAPVGTVPLYEAAERVDQIEELTVDTLFEVIERHGRQGVDFMTVHCGLLHATSTSRSSARPGSSPAAARSRRAG